MSGNCVLPPRGRIGEENVIYSRMGFLSYFRTPSPACGPDLSGNQGCRTFSAALGLGDYHRVWKIKIDRRLLSRICWFIQSDPNPVPSRTRTLKADERGTLRCE